MAAYALQRLTVAIPTILIIIALSFALMYSAPGGPFDVDAALEPEVLENLKRAYDLDKPVYIQFFMYVSNVLQGDLGPSIVYKDFTVTELLVAGLPVSINLGLKALFVALILGGSLGIFAALNQNSIVDYSVMTLAMTGIAVPSFVTAPLLTLFFGILLVDIPILRDIMDPLPIAGWGGFRNQILPITALALPQIAILARLSRGSMVEVLKSNYIRTARAKGLRENRVLMRHALRAAILPVVSYLGPAVAGIVTGSVIIEQIFGLPGVGRYFIQGAINRDYPLVLGIVIVYASAVIILNLVVDIVYGLLDPKVRYK